MSIISDLSLSPWKAIQARVRPIAASGKREFSVAAVIIFYIAPSVFGCCLVVFFGTPSRALAGQLSAFLGVLSALLLAFFPSVLSLMEKAAEVVHQGTDEAIAQEALDRVHVCRDLATECAVGVYLVLLGAGAGLVVLLATPTSAQVGFQIRVPVLIEIASMTLCSCVTALVITFLSIANGFFKVMETHGGLLEQQVRRRIHRR